MGCSSRRKPDWLKIKLPKGQLSVEVLNVVRGHNLHTICTSGMCPNQGECWGCGTATFMIKKKDIDRFVVFRYNYPTK